MLPPTPCKGRHVHTSVAGSMTLLHSAADAAGMEWHQGCQDQEAMQMGGTAGEATLPLGLSGSFPSPADYAALLHHDPAHTSQQVQLPDALWLSNLL